MPNDEVNRVPAPARRVGPPAVRRQGRGTRGRWAHCVLVGDQPRCHTSLCGHPSIGRCRHTFVAAARYCRALSSASFANVPSRWALRQPCLAKTPLKKVWTLLIGGAAKPDVVWGA